VRPATIAIVALIAAVGVGCGDEGVGDGKLSNALGLEETDEGDAMNGDLLCLVSELLNDEEEVEAAVDADAPVVVSRDQTLGIEVVTPFAPDCEEKARRELNRLERQAE
jgi:hypothetical protein